MKRKKQAEFLVLDDLLPELIVGMGCFNETARQRLIDMGVDGNKIKIIPNAYF